MRTLIRIAEALESIARDLHTLATPTTKVTLPKNEKTQSEKCSDNAKMPHWKAKELQLLKDAYDEHIPLEEISKLLGRTPGACRVKAQAMGWAKKRKSGRLF